MCCCSCASGASPPHSTSCLCSCLSSHLSEQGASCSAAVCAVGGRQADMRRSVAHILLCIKLWITPCITTFQRFTGAACLQCGQGFINTLLPNFYTHLLTHCVNICTLFFSALRLLSTIYPHYLQFSSRFFRFRCVCSLVSPRSFPLVIGGLHWGGAGRLLWLAKP